MNENKGLKWPEGIVEKAIELNCEIKSKEQRLNELSRCFLRLSKKELKEFRHLSEEVAGLKGYIYCLFSNTLHKMVNSTIEELLPKIDLRAKISEEISKFALSKIIDENDPLKVMLMQSQISAVMADWFLNNSSLDEVKTTFENLYLSFMLVISSYLKNNHKNSND